MPHTLESFFGGGTRRVPGFDVVVNPGRGRLQTFEFSSAGLVAILPDARLFPQPGGPVFMLLNLGVHDFDVEDLDGGYVGTVEPGKVGTALLTSVDEAAGHWHLMVRDFTRPSDVATPDTPTPTPTPTPTSNTPTPTPTPPDPTVSPTPTGSYGVTEGQIETRPIPFTTIV